MSTRERFLAKVSPCPETGCWLWTGAYSKNRRGSYPRFWFRGKTRRAHRVALELFRGLRLRKRFAGHGCDVTACVCPFHLAPVTPSQNMQDMIKRGRGRGQFQRRSA